MRKNLSECLVVTALIGFTALPLVVRAEDKMMSKDKMMMEKGIMGITAMQKKVMMKNMMWCIVASSCMLQNRQVFQINMRLRQD